METPSWELPNPLAFSIPFSPKKLQFKSEFIDKMKFQKLDIDHRFLQAVNFHLANHVDKNVLFYLKFLGGDNGLIKYQNNKVSYFRNKQLMNCAVPTFEYPVDANTMALYHLNEATQGTGTAKDEAGNSNGTYAGPIASEGRVISPGSYLDGSDDYINCGTDSSLDFGTGNFSVEAWIKSTGTGKNIVISKTDGSSNGWYLRLEDATHYVYFWTAQSFPTNYRDARYDVANIMDNTWHHIAGVKAGPLATNLYIFLDGIDVTNATHASDGANPNTDLVNNMLIGAETTTTKNYLGNFDEIRVSNTPRTKFGGVAPGVIL